jgi:hypothetical protein
LVAGVGAALVEGGWGGTDAAVVWVYVDRVFAELVEQLSRVVVVVTWRMVAVQVEAFRNLLLTYQQASWLLAEFGIRVLSVRELLGRVPELVIGKGQRLGVPSSAMATDPSPTTHATIVGVPSGPPGFEGFVDRYRAVSDAVDRRELLFAVLDSLAPEAFEPVAVSISDVGAALAPHASVSGMLADAAVVRALDAALHGDLTKARAQVRLVQPDLTPSAKVQWITWLMSLKKQHSNQTVRGVFQALALAVVDCSTKPGKQ